MDPDYPNTWRKPPPLKRMESTTLQTYRPKIISDNVRKMEDLCRDLIVNNDHIHVVEQRLRQAINQGLDKRTHETASVKCYPTYVRLLPTGKETGRFLALDLGGTNFRVLVVNIGKDEHCTLDSEVYPIPHDLMIGPGQDLFAHIADCLFSFVKKRELMNERLPLGFTFSFPCTQENLTKGRLTHWTKGFQCSDVEGEDVVSLLNNALTRKKIPIDVCAILNDTTGCLMSCAWKNKKCRIGLIIGTGTNACYLEDLENVECFEGDRTTGPKHMIINTEWGGFGSKGELDFIRTKWDESVDEGSINPGAQIFEKMISGMYMGELTRQVLVDMISENIMFSNQKDTRAIFEWGRFHSRFVSEIESDPVGVYTRNRAVCSELGLENVSEEDCSALRYICELVSRRAAFMASAGITALLKKMDYKDVVVAIDGSVFRYHPHFANVMKSRISQLMGIDYAFDLMLSTDGSGRGAALVAAVLTNSANT